MSTGGPGTRRLDGQEGPRDFGRVYSEHVRAVYGFLAYRLRDNSLAEDLTQTTFEKAMRGWGRFDSRKASERTWLLVIARNLLIDHRRKAREHSVADVDERLLPQVSGPETNLGIAPELSRALAQLPARDREVVALRFGADLTGPEIATLIGLSLGNVQQILSRSLRRLRALLETSDAL